MVFVADDLAAWLVGLLADAGRRRLATLVLGSGQERALGQAATAAVQLTAHELCPDDEDRAVQLAMVVSQVFGEPLPGAPLTGQATLLEALQAGIAGQLVSLGDVGLTGTGQSSAELLGVSVGALADKLTGYMVREIMTRGAQGRPLWPLADQLNHDMAQLQGQRLEGMLAQLAGEVRGTLARLGDTSEPPVTVTCSLPPDTVAFIGRDRELGEIMVAVTDAAEAGRVVAIHAIDGMPGVGKTALAVHAAWQLRDQFPDGQLFVDLQAYAPIQGPMRPEAALATLLIAGGVDTRRLPGDLQGRVALWRDQMAAKRVLLILDNAADSEQVAPLIPGGAGCLVLVTSRRHLGDLPATVVPVLLNALAPCDAQRMFLSLAPRAADDRAAVAELTASCGHLPLAIWLLARVYDKHPSWTMRDLVSETTAKLLTVRAENRSIAAAFDLSYQYLAPAQQRFFRYLGVNPGIDIDPYAAAALVSVPVEEAAERLDALCSDHLLVESGYRRHGMHDLIRAYTRALADTELSRQREQAVGRLLNYYEHTAAFADTALAPRIRTTARSVTPPAAVPELPDPAHALAWLRAERANLLACVDYATHFSQGSRVAGLTASLASLLRLDGPWSDAAILHANAAAAAQQVGDRLGEANALHDLGVMRALSGDYPASAPLLGQALAIFSDLGDRLGQAETLKNLGGVRRLSGDSSGATAAQDQALSIFRDLGNRFGEANALVELAMLLGESGHYANWRAGDLTLAHPRCASARAETRCPWRPGRLPGRVPGLCSAAGAGIGNLPRTRQSAGRGHRPKRVGDRAMVKRGLSGSRRSPRAGIENLQ